MRTTTTTHGYVSSVCTFIARLVLARVRFLRLVYFEAAEFSGGFCFSDIPRAPAPLCDQGLLRQRGNVRTTTTTISSDY